MHPSDYGRGPWLGRGRRNFWLLPLLIGIGIGALLFGPSRGYRSGYGHAYKGWNGPGAYAPQYGQQWAQPAPPAAGQAVPPAAAAPRTTEGQYFNDRGPAGDRFGYGHRHRGGPFFPFAGLRLLLPLLLIGAGAWLFFRGRQGPGGWSGPSGMGGQPNQPGTPPPPPAQPTSAPSTATPTPPATGETRHF